MLKLNKSRFFVLNGLIAAIYTVLTLALPFIGFGQIQFRVSEAMCLLPAVIPGSAVGVTLGCFLSNLLGAFIGVNPVGIIDSVVGTFATALTCIAVILLAKVLKKQWTRMLLLPLPAVLFNAVIVGAELAFLYPPVTTVKFLSFALSVGLGEAAVCYTLGNLLLIVLLKRNKEV